MTTLGAILLILVIFYFYAQWVETRWFRICRVRIQLKKKLARPLMLLHITDTHFFRKEPHKQRFFSRLAKLNPDLIFVTGDIIDNDEGIDEAVRLLGSLKARFGKFAILGNHDYYDYRWMDNINYHLIGRKTTDRANRSDDLKRRLEEVGVSVLVNQSKEVLVEGAKLVIAGADDPITQRADFEKLKQEVTADSFNILLTHSLDSIVKAPDFPADLILAGHTHGTQFRLPWIGGYFFGYKLPRRYMDGVNPWRNAVTYVSRGIGASRLLSVRICCRPEAAWLEVTSS